MLINYIILAHKTPDQVSRLVKRLSSPQARFYVHIDKPVPLEDFKKALAGMENCFFIPDNKRLATSWGHVNAVRAPLVAMQQIVNDGRSGTTVLMSGQDYPIKSTAYIEQYLTENYGQNFIESFPLPVTEHTESIFGGLNRKTWIHPDYGINGGLDRLNHYTFHLSYKRGDNITIPPIFSADFLKGNHLRPALGLLKRQPLSALQLLKFRKLPGAIKPFGGSQWWTLPHETILFLLDYVKTQPEFLEFCRFSLLSDEIFYQSVVGSYLNNIAHPVTYVNFNRPTGSLPATFVETDIQELTDNRCLFARKFDLELDTRILDLLDNIGS